MKTKTYTVLIVVVLLTYWLGLCNASAFYDPGTQRWLNRDPLREPGFAILRNYEANPLGNKANLYVFVGNAPLSEIDAFGLQWISILFPPSTTGNPFTCALVSRTAPIDGDRTPGSGNHNGESACIWRCNYFGDQVAIRPPSTWTTYAKPGKPCQPPNDPNTGRKCKYQQPYKPGDWGDATFE